LYLKHQFLLLFEDQIQLIILENYQLPRTNNPSVDPF
jgi:hypothetical protein